MTRTSSLRTLTLLLATTSAVYYAGLQDAYACHGTGPYPNGEPGLENLGEGPDGCYGGVTGAHATSSAPVQLFRGHKIETATDLNVPLTGRDFSFDRSYTSKPGTRGLNTFGANWFIDSFPYVEFVPTEEVGSYSNAKMFRLFSFDNTSEYFHPGGSTTQRGYYYDTTTSSNRTGTRANADALSLWDPHALDTNGDRTISKDRVLWYEEEPGQWTRAYFNVGEPNDPDNLENGADGFLDGLLAYSEDWYGNRWYYEYAEHGEVDPAIGPMRCIAIWCYNASQDPTTDRPEAKVEFEWIAHNDPLTENDTTNPLEGYLRRIIVLRPKPGSSTDLEETQRVIYHYYEDVTDFHTTANLDLGKGYTNQNDGSDLVQVVRYEQVADDEGSSYPDDVWEPLTGKTVGSVDYGKLDTNHSWRARVTQYRYYSDETANSYAGSTHSLTGWDVLPAKTTTVNSVEIADPLGTAPTPPASYQLGTEHQLKLIIDENQFEYAAQKINEDAGNGNEKALEEIAEDLLELEDHEAVYDGEDCESTNPNINVLDLASKRVLLYDLTRHASTHHEYGQVLKQFVRANCGCGSSGSNTEGTLYEYGFYRYTPFAYDATTVEVQSVVDPDNSTCNDPEFNQHKISYYDFNDYDIFTDGTIETAPPIYVVNKAVFSESPTVNTSATRWVTRYEYDFNTKNVIQQITPSGLDSYTPATHTAAPSYTYDDTSGKSYHYLYNTDNRLVETAIAEGGEAYDDASPVTLEKTTYGNGTPGSGASDNTFDWLVTKRELYMTGTSTASEIETYTYRYGFYENENPAGEDYDADESRIAWVEMTNEGEQGGENGPLSGSSSNKEYAVFDDLGNLVWSIDASGAHTKREYDHHSGNVTKIIRNADATSLGLGDVWGAAPSVTDTYADGGSLTHEREYDALGRITKTISPGDVTTEYRHELRLGEAALRSNFRYYGIIELPHIVDATNDVFDGSASVRLFNADNDVISESTYEPVESSGAYSSDTNTALGGASPNELTRTYVHHDRSGQVTSVDRYHNLPSGYYTDQYFYDPAGRLKYVFTAQGNVTKYEYDNLDRLTKESTGAVVDPDDWDDVTRDWLDNTSNFTAYLQHEYEYDDDSHGNGMITEYVAHTDEISPFPDKRTYTLEYDFRDRMVELRADGNPTVRYEYDNLDRLTERGLFSSNPTSMTTTNRVYYEKTHYGQRGLAYQKQVSLDPDATTQTYLDTDYWYDARGMLIAQRIPGGRVTEYDIDGLGRTEDVYITDGAGLTPGSYSTYTKATDRTGDTVLESVHADYHTSIDASSPTAAFDHAGRIEFSTVRQRAHDSSTTGALESIASANSVASYVGYEYDDADRLITSIDFGTKDSNGLFQTGTAPTSTDIATPPAAAHVRAQVYDARGLIETITDAEGIEHKLVYDDLNRTVAQIENYNNASVSRVTLPSTTEPWGWTVDLGASNPDDEDRTTLFGYDNDDQMTHLVAVNGEDGSGDNVYQVTLYEYDVDFDEETSTTITGEPKSTLNSHGLVSRITYPDEYGETTPKTELYIYNTQGEIIAVEDQNGTVRRFERDFLGRVVNDDAIKLGTSIDDAVRRINYAYNTSGQLTDVKSYDGYTGSPSVINALHYEYNDLWQLTRQHHNPIGDINLTTPPTHQLVTEYGYSESDSDNDNYSRLETLKYPSAPGSNRTELDMLYGGATPSGLSDAISRVSSMAWTGGGSTALAVDYDYVGSGFIAITDIVSGSTPTTLAKLDRHVAPDSSGTTTSGRYYGWDEFGRVRRQTWLPDGWTATTQPAIFDHEYTYDEVNNPTARYDRRVNSSSSYTDKDEEYSYDDLHRLIQMDKGDLNGSTLTHAAGMSRQWDLDQLGNQSERIVDTGTAYGTFSSTADTRRDITDINVVNEIRSIELYVANTLTEKIQPDYDDVGNMSERLFKDGSDTLLVTWDYTYDAWNRLKKVEVDEDLRAEYSYYGLHQRATRHADTDLSSPGTVDERNLYYYDAQWRLLEERVLGPIETPTEDWTDHDATIQRIWGLEYIDQLLYHQVDEDSGSPDGDFTDATIEFEVITDRLYSVVVTDRERLEYSPYGVARAWDHQDLDRDGDVDGGDLGLLLANWQSTTQLASPYGPKSDFNYDGYVNGSDLGLQLADQSAGTTSPSTGDLTNRAFGNTVGYSGYLYDPAIGMSLARYRWYDAEYGRWINRDPIRYWAGSTNLYEYVTSRPSIFVDPYGLLGWRGRLWCWALSMKCKAPEYPGRPMPQRRQPCSSAPNKPNYSPDGRNPNLVPPGQNRPVPKTRWGTPIEPSEPADQIGGDHSNAAGEMLGTAADEIRSEVVGGAVFAVFGVAGKVVSRGARAVRRAVAPSRRAARRAAKRASGTPANSVPDKVVEVGETVQEIYRNADGDVVITHHGADAAHPDPHFHVGTPRYDGNGNIIVNSNGIVRYNAVGGPHPYSGGG